LPQKKIDCVLPEAYEDATTQELCARAATSQVVLKIRMSSK